MDAVQMPGVVARLTEIEGELVALRRLVVRLAAQRSDAGELAEWLAARGAVQAGDEDPGLLPSPEFALQVAVAEAFRRLETELKRLLSEQTRRDGA